MAKLMWCWRCQMEIPMLEDHEWEKVHPLLNLHNAFAERELYAIKHGISLAKAKEHGPCYRALDEYFKLTGFRETNSNALHHHRVSLYGPPCEACGKPFRTPMAKYCAACGRLRQE